MLLGARRTDRARCAHRQTDLEDVHDRRDTAHHRKNIGKGGMLGGIQWGSATDGKNVYAALSDIAFITEGFGTGQRPVVNPKTGGGLFAMKVETGEKVWTAPPPDCGDRPNCSPAQS